MDLPLCWISFRGKPVQINTTVFHGAQWRHQVSKREIFSIYMTEEKYLPVERHYLLLCSPLLLWTLTPVPGYELLERRQLLFGNSYHHHTEASIENSLYKWGVFSFVQETLGLQSAALSAVANNWKHGTPTCIDNGWINCYSHITEQWSVIGNDLEDLPEMSLRTTILPKSGMSHFYNTL